MFTGKAGLIRMFIIDDIFSYTIMLQRVLRSNNGDTAIIVVTKHFTWFIDKIAEDTERRECPSKFTIYTCIRTIAKIDRGKKFCDFIPAAWKIHDWISIEKNCLESRTRLQSQQRHYILYICEMKRNLLERVLMLSVTFTCNTHQLIEINSFNIHVHIFKSNTVDIFNMKCNG